jgi:predicted lipoprotein
MKKSIHIFLILFLFSLVSCQEDEIEDKKEYADMSRFLTNYSDSLIIPSYEDFLGNLKQLELSLNTYQSGSLVGLKGLSLKTYLSWQHCAYFDFGPATQYSLDQNINIYPVDTTKLKSQIETPPTDISASTFAATKGLPAIQHILYTNDTLSAKQKEYLKICIADIKSKVEPTLDSWKSSYKNTFTANVGFDAGSSICFLSNGFIKYFEKYYRDGKLGYPLGVRSSNVLQPQLAEGYLTNSSHLLFKESTLAIKNVYFGKEGLGFDDVLRSANSKMDASALAEMENLLVKINTDVSSIQSPIEQFVSSENAKGKLLYTDIQRELVYFKIELINALSLKIKYIDEDGD